MNEQIHILNKFQTGREKNLQSLFGRNLIKNIKICDIYKFNKSLNSEDYLLARELLHNPISQEFFSKDKPKTSIVAKISAACGSISLLGVVFTPADVPSLYSLHIFFANSVFNCALLTLGIYAYLFYSQGLKNVTYALFVCLFIVFGYIVFLEIGPPPWKSIEALTMHATYQKIAVLSLVGTIWIMSKGTDILNDKV